MIRVRVIALYVFLFTVSYGQLSPGCIPDHCTCTVHNTTAIPAQHFNVDEVDWRPIVLATALGTAASSLLMTSMAVWWTWKSSSLGVPDGPPSGKPSMNPRGGSPSASSDGSWATPRNRYPNSDIDWLSPINSRGSDGYGNRGKDGKKVWPGQFE